MCSSVRTVSSDWCFTSASGQLEGLQCCTNKCSAWELRSHDECCAPADKNLPWRKNKTIEHYKHVQSGHLNLLVPWLDVNRRAGLRLTSLFSWGCDPIRFQVVACWRCWTPGCTAWCWCASGPKWRPSLARSCQCSENTWSAVVSRTAPPWPPDPQTHRLDRPQSSQGNCGSPAPRTKQIVEGIKQQPGHEVLRLRRLSGVKYLLWW